MATRSVLTAVPCGSAEADRAEAWRYSAPRWLTTLCMTPTALVRLVQLAPSFTAPSSCCLAAALEVSSLLTAAAWADADRVGDEDGDGVGAGAGVAAEVAVGRAATA